VSRDESCDNCAPWRPGRNVPRILFPKGMVGSVSHPWRSHGGVKRNVTRQYKERCSPEE
jgi:hypothetical protein